jgi:putative ubiquitin-RnfH superfamily antitoxin RatB of RatAB toxin-antitoxin module
MLDIEIVYALKEKQYFYDFKVPTGTTVSEAIKISPLLIDLPDLDISSFGIFSAVVKGNQVLNNGERIEIYRPLIADPKQSRRERSQAKKDEQK